jgi:CBS domain containing-hemolysin-like protein
MVRGVFQLADRTVRSIMTPRREVLWLDVLAPAETIRRKVLDSGRSRYPLARGTIDDLMGVALTQDILRDLDTKQTIGAKTCANQPLIVPPGLSALRLLERFRRDRNHFAVVIDEFGQVQGVVTPTDVLEAIAGDMPEPGDAPSPSKREADGVWLFDGGADLRRVVRETGARLPVDQPYTTLAGYVLAACGHLPSPGDSVASDAYVFEVVSLDGNRIGKVRVRRKAPAQPAPAASSADS